MTMTHSQKSLVLLILLVLALLSGCAVLWPNGKGVYGPVINGPVINGPVINGEEQAWSPMWIQPEPAIPAPDNTLYPPAFEESSTVVEWARPIAPENSFNTQFSPDGQYLLYLTRHPGTRWVSLYSVRLAGGDPFWLATANREEEIFYFTVTPDSQRVIYYQYFSGAGLHSNAITGGDEVQLSDWYIWEMLLSPDGRWVVYWGEGIDDKPAGTESHDKDVVEGDDGLVRGLYSIPVTGGESVRVGGGMSSSRSYQITPDSRYVLYVAPEELGVGVDVELYRAPIEGGKILQLSQDEPFQVALSNSVFVTPDSQTILYGNLYQVSIDGGTPLQLNHAAAQSYFPYSSLPQLTLDGQWVLFLAGDIVNNLVSLFSASLSDGQTRQLNGLIGGGVGVKGFRISPDSQSVTYWQGLRDQDSNLATYTVPVAGGSPLPVPDWHAAPLSADGRWFVYMDDDGEGGVDLYSAAAEGGEPIKLSTSIPTDSTVATFSISPDSQRVFYLTSKNASYGMPTFDGLYQVPITGGVAREVTGIDGQPNNLGFLFAPDGQTVLTFGDYDGDGRFAIYAFPPLPIPAPEE